MGPKTENKPVDDAKMREMWDHYFRPVKCQSLTRGDKPCVIT